MNSFYNLFTINNSLCYQKSYDLFLHNCNNFTNDFAMFLVGKGIPEHITSLPQTVLDTPFGQMLKPQLENSMRGITQAPTPSYAVRQQNPLPNAAYVPPNPERNQNTIKSSIHPTGIVHNITKLHEMEALLASAKRSCAIVFFTSATCPPCKIVYPAYDELAAEAGNKAVLIKVDISQAYEISSKYQIRATPTFMTFLKGEKENEWSGAHEGRLRANVQLLIQMAHPPHHHTNMKLPTLQRLHQQPVIYTKIPPLEKLIAKLGNLHADQSIVALKDFISARETSGAAESPLPSLPTIGKMVISSLNNLEPSSLFPIIDLFRLALVDPRVSGYFAEEPSHATVVACLNKISSLGENCPYPLRIVTLQTACNLFTSRLFPLQLLSNFSLLTPLIQLVTSSLLDTSHPPICVVAASLAYNIAAFNHLQRLNGVGDALAESAQVELMASILEALGQAVGNKDEMKGLLLAAGLLAYSAPKDEELADLCNALGAKAVVTGIKGSFEDLGALIAEVEMVMG